MSNLFRAFVLCLAFFSLASFLVAKQPPPPAPDAIWMTYPTQANLPPANKNFQPTANFNIKIFPQQVRMVNVFINSLVYDGNFGLIKTQVWTDSTVFVPDNTIFLQFKNCNLPSGFYEVKIDWGVAGNPATWVFEQPTYFGIP